jgi:hypothetical protein
MNARIGFGILVFALAMACTAHAKPRDDLPDATLAPAAGLASGTPQSERADTARTAAPTRTPAEGPGGALFNPFAEAPDAPRKHPLAGKKPADTDRADFSLTAVVALGGIALFAYLLRRAWAAP